MELDKHLEFELEQRFTCLAPQHRTQTFSSGTAPWPSPVAER